MSPKLVKPQMIFLQNLIKAKHQKGTSSMSISIEKFLSQKSTNYPPSTLNCLKDFDSSSFSFKNSAKDLDLSGQMARQILSQGKRFFVCGFGGACSTFEILENFQLANSPDIILLNKFNARQLTSIHCSSVQELEDTHWIFISKSGETSELFFYTNLLEKTYSKMKVSAKNKISILSSRADSRLCEWGKIQEAKIHILDWPLPGRFSFFTSNGLFQSYLLGVEPSGFQATQKRCEKLRSQIQETLEFIFYQQDKAQEPQEVYFVYFGEQSKGLAKWCEKVWHESLFKNKSQQMPAKLKWCSFLDFKHCYLEELMSCKKNRWVWGLEIGESTYVHQEKNQMKQFLQEQKIDYLFLDSKKADKESLEDIIFIFYKLLYGLGSKMNINIFNQPHIDSYKKNYLRRDNKK